MIKLGKRKYWTEQIGFQTALKTSKCLRWSNRLRQTVPHCWTGNREGSVSKLSSCPWITNLCNLLWTCVACEEVKWLKPRIDLILMTFDLENYFHILNNKIDYNLKTTGQIFMQWCCLSWFYKSNKVDIFELDICPQVLTQCTPDTVWFFHFICENLSLCLCNTMDMTLYYKHI